MGPAPVYEWTWPQTRGSNCISWELRCAMTETAETETWPLSAGSVCLGWCLNTHGANGVIYTQFFLFFLKSVIRQHCLLPNMVSAAKLLRHSAISNQCKKVWGACPGRNHCFPHCQLIWLWFAALECDECLSLKSYSSALTWLRRPRREKKIRSGCCKKES